MEPHSITYPTPSVYDVAHAIEERKPVFFSYLKLIGCSCLRK